MYYRIIFNICHFHKWDIASVEDLIPYELQIYFDLIKEHIEESSKKVQGDGGYGQLAKELKLK